MSFGNVFTSNGTSIVSSPLWGNCHPPLTFVVTSSSKLHYCIAGKARQPPKLRLSLSLCTRKRLNFPFSPPFLPSSLPPSSPRGKKVREPWVGPKIVPVYCSYFLHFCRTFSVQSLLRPNNSEAQRRKEEGFHLRPGNSKGSLFKGREGGGNSYILSRKRTFFSSSFNAFDNPFEEGEEAI